MENIEAMLCAYIEGDLDATGRAQIEKHLQDHPQHKKLMEDLIAMRDMVRALPRVKAPMDVGESLRSQVERSILLDDSLGRAEPSEPASRWPQFFAIAAILLLCASLVLVLYKALGPTLKPPVFTENVPAVASKSPELQPIEKDMQTAVVPPAAQQNWALDSRVSAPATMPSSAPMVAQQQLPYVDALLQNQAANFSQLDVNEIRQRLQNSGFGVAGAGDKTASPILMMVNSTNPPATNVQIAEFLNNSKGISWKLVPAGNELKSLPTTLPDVANVDAGQSKTASAQNSTMGLAVNENPAVTVPTTQPASDVYVANGLTAQQADALRQSLSARQSDAQVQVSLQSAVMLATTQPSESAAVKPADANELFGVAPTTQPTVAESGLPTTAPSNVAPGNVAGTTLGGAAEANAPAAILNNNLGELNNSRLLQQVDAVIVIQSTVATPAAPTPVLPSAPTPLSPTTQPAPDVVPTPPAIDLTPATTQPAPSTQP